MLTTLEARGDGYGYRRSGAVSALAVAAAHGRRRVVRRLLSTGESMLVKHPGAGSQGGQDAVSASDFLMRSSSSGALELASRQVDGTSVYARASRATQRALADALYLAVEQQHVDVAVELHNLGESA